MITSRRYDLDWLRILAFGILIYFHTAIIFIHGGLPMIQNVNTSVGLEIFVDISHQFRLALLFFISGIGVAFAKKRRSNRGFILERSRRLLIPLIFGITFIVPPMVYTENLFLGRFSGSLFEFYSQLLTHGIYPNGYLSWHHLWFLVYLFLYCILGLRIFEWLTKNNNRRLNWFARNSKGLRIYRFIIPLVIVEICLRAIFPGFRDLIHDWASFSQWFLIFLAGFVFANHAKLLDTADRLRYLSLITVALATFAMYGLYGGMVLDVEFSDRFIVVKYITYCALRITMIWTSILTCIGFAARHLQFSNNLLVYMNEAVYPLFILHLTIITLLGYWVVQLNWGLWLKYAFITSSTICIVIGLYHFTIRPFNLMRLLFGIKPV